MKNIHVKIIHYVRMSGSIVMWNRLKALRSSDWIIWRELITLIRHYKKHSIKYVKNTLTVNINIGSESKALDNDLKSDLKIICNWSKMIFNTTSNINVFWEPLYGINVKELMNFQNCEKKIFCFILFLQWTHFLHLTTWNLIRHFRDN